MNKRLSVFSSSIEHHCGPIRGIQGQAEKVVVRVVRRVLTGVRGRSTGSLQIEDSAAVVVRPRTAVVDLFPRTAVCQISIVGHEQSAGPGKKTSKLQDIWSFLCANAVPINGSAVSPGDSQTVAICSGSLAGCCCGRPNARPTRCNRTTRRAAPECRCQSGLSA
jgi:hypothetical protein